MRSVRLHGIRDLRVEDIDAPVAPGRHEVTLTLSMAGICGSDLHNYRTGAWITRAPSVAGHEFTGKVTASGAGVAHVSVGDRVIVDSRHVCGTCCACRAGRAQVCENLGFLGETMDGGFAEAVTLPARNVIRAPDGVADRHLAMAEPLAVALHTLKRLNPDPEAEIVIAGCGAIGGLVALLAAGRGHRVAVIDRMASRAALVAEVTGGRVTDLDAAWKAATRPRYAVDATGASTVIARLADGLAGGGALALVGIGSGAAQLDPTGLVEREISLLGCHAFQDELHDISGLLPGLADRLDRLIDREIPLEDVPAAYDAHLAGQIAGLKTIIRCQGGRDV